MRERVRPKIGRCGARRLIRGGTQDPTPKPPPRARGGGLPGFVDNEPTARGWGRTPKILGRTPQIPHICPSAARGLYCRFGGAVASAGPANGRPRRLIVINNCYGKRGVGPAVYPLQTVDVSPVARSIPSPSPWPSPWPSPSPSPSRRAPGGRPTGGKPARRVLGGRALGARAAGIDR